jgi:hypothetical protein
MGIRGSVVGWGTTLQAGWSRDRIPDEVEFFNLPNPSSRTMALGSTQPLTEMSTRNIPGGEGRPVRKADNLTAICEPIVYKNVGASISHNHMGLRGLLKGYLYLITADNRWLTKTRSIPYWTTSVFSSVWLTWFWFTNRSLLQLPLSAG